MVSLVKADEGGVDVSLVEYLTTVDQIAFDSQNIDPPPLASKPSCEVPCPTHVKVAPRLLSRGTVSM